MSCSELSEHKPMGCLEHKGRVVAGVLIKNGMAYKAAIKYLKNGDVKSLQRQIDKGIAKVYYL